jgi:hypothetical protein
MTPTLPFTTGVLDPFATRVAFGFGRDTTTSGNDHSNASAAIFPGVWGFPSMMSC